MGDGEEGYDVDDGFDEASEFCPECGQYIDRNMLWDGKCITCERRMIDFDIEKETE
jgi:hypothetical protein